VTGRRVAVVILVLLGIFAIQGGEYSSWDYLTLRRERTDERRQIADLEERVDSLARAAIAVETDPVVQERVARERYGMLRDGEFGYQIIRDDEP
jgi:cell division protein FtsB